MTYELLDLWSTQDLSSLVLSTQTDHRARNTMSHAETQATEARVRHSVEIAIMALGPTPLMSSVIMSMSSDDNVHVVNICDPTAHHGFTHVVLLGRTVSLIVTRWFAPKNAGLLADLYRFRLLRIV
jgi:hypothetical protein